MGKAVTVAKIVGDKNKRRERQEIVKPGELVSARPLSGKTLSLPALKAYNLMLSIAQAEGFANVRYSIKKAALRRTHKGNERIAGLLDELHGIAFMVPGVLDGKKGVWRMSLLSPSFEEEGDDDSGSVHFRFPEELLSIVQTSASWALLLAKTMVKFSSIYGLRLYEIGCQYVTRDEPFLWMTPMDLRELMLVPEGAYQDWANLRRNVVDKAISEINQLAHFTAKVPEASIKRSGRKVLKFLIEFSIKPDDEAEDAETERNRHSIGRRARRDGTIETVVTTHEVAARRLGAASLDKRLQWYEEAVKRGAPTFSAPATKGNINRWIAWVDKDVLNDKGL